MFKYFAKNYSTATDFRMAARYLATQKIRATIQGNTLRTSADPATVMDAINKGYAKFGY